MSLLLKLESYRRFVLRRALLTYWHGISLLLHHLRDWPASALRCTVVKKITELLTSALKTIIVFL